MKRRKKTSKINLNELNTTKIKDNNNKLEQLQHKYNHKFNPNSRISNIQNIGISQYISKLANLSNFDNK